MVTTGLSGVLCPGLGLKAWALINGAAGTIIKQSNVASVVRNAAGQWTITLTSPMASVNYVVLDRKPHFFKK